ncbi:endo-alpha-N-acetylgalactosaminidase family protein [Schleiferilactobacillus perolens]|jgi:endo-alpha-N-acetylgalactosaminidase|uniref:endo-alpha-N-acetylgalactosaminidase family protein n=1 Tax=Schleiferilactobacillus perolens TaxID=100468 RepID=UPI0023537EBE|nr:endo-alpha-N-acetylgalactosaminidase family protein [Schleiferilactobacillus perolens]MCI2169971.1 endo-alpha-N-acetylgalactosaminidase family protein [Schleiferilactobacillus perolens]
MKRKNYNRLYISLAAMVLIPVAGAVVYHQDVHAADVVATKTDAVAYQTNLQNTANWQSMTSVNGFKASYADGALNLQRLSGTENNTVLVDTASPVLADGEAQYTFKYTDAGAKPTEVGRVGISFRDVQTTKQWAFVGYSNNGNWVVEADHDYSGSGGSSWKDLNINQQLQPGQTYTLKVRYTGKHLTAWLNDTQIIDGDYAFLPTAAGQVGTRLWYDTKTLSITSFSANSIQSGGEVTPEDPDKIVKVAPISLQTSINQAPTLPATVKGTTADGRTVDVPVTWGTVDPAAYSKAGSFNVTGTAAELPVTATIAVTVPIPTYTGPTIESAAMKVTLSDKYPEVHQYFLKDTGKTFNGTQDELTMVRIDGTDYQPTITYEPQSATQGVYHISIADKVTFDVLATVQDKTFKFKVQNVQEIGAFKLHTLEFPGQNMISVYSSEADASFAGAKMNTATSASTDGATGDTFRKLDTQAPNKTEHYMYGFLNNHDTAAAIWTNAALDGSGKSENNRITYSTKQTDSGVNTGLGTGPYTLRPLEDNSTPFTGTLIPLPEVAVSFGKDENGDNQVDWQDAAIAFRQIMNEPMGWQDTRRVVAQRIPMNFASQATNPFLDTLDETKRVYNITDGLGQTVLLKGYQSEGHDSAHPDYGAIGARQGGVDDMNTLINDGHEYNASFGVHVNDTETYPEAKAFSEQLADPSKRGWDWLDPSYMIKQRDDAISGNRYNRFKELKSEPPNLDFIYVDVWGNQGEAGWESRRLAAEINGLGWEVHNEFPNALEYDSLWNHWSAEKAYGGSSTKGFNSNIVRFIRNNEKDTWVISDNSLLGGAEFEAYEGWVGKTDFASFVDKTYQTDLPTKFLQHYEITNWNAAWDNAKKDYVGAIKLDHGVVVDNSTGTKTITVNGTTVLNDKLTYGQSVGHTISYLLPWDSTDKVGNGIKAGTTDTDGLNFDKLYYWNDAGTTTTWQLLDQFKGASALHIYQLTDQGRIDKGTVAVVNGQVTLNLAAKTAYVLTIAAETPENVTFGTGSHLKDPGFNAKDTLTTNWHVDSGNPIVTKTDMGDYVVQAGAAKMAISQSITDLKKGNWSVYVNTETHNRPVTITVTVGGKTFTKTFKDSTAQNFIQADVNHTVGYQEKNASYMQKARVDFVVPTDGAEATLTISTDAGAANDHTYFDDVRVVTRNTDLTVNKDGESEDKDGNKVVIYQDFEDTQAIGLYPFEKGSAGGVEDPRVHLSERHDKYTQYGWNGNRIDDVLSGNWSLKAHKQGDGLIYQTIPQTVYFAPGKRYKVEFDYQTDGDKQYTPGFVDGEYTPGENLGNAAKFTLFTALRATNGDQSTADLTANHTQHFSGTITGAADGKLGFFIYKADGDTGFILDNFLVTEMNSPVITVQPIKAQAGTDPKTINWMTGVKAVDANGKDYTSQIKVDYSKADFTQPGQYQVFYRISNNAGEVIAENTAVLTLTDKDGNVPAYVTATESGYVLTSPNGQVKTTVAIDQNQQLTYSVVRDGKTFVGSSQMGFTVNGVDYGKNVHFGQPTTGYIVNDQISVLGNSATTVNPYVVVSVPVITADGVTYQVNYRLYNDGTAFSYQFNGSGNNKVQETTQFVVPEGTKAWAGYDAEHYANYESLVQQLDLTKAGAAGINPAVALQLTDGSYAALLEGNANATYPGTAFNVVGSNTFQIQTNWSTTTPTVTLNGPFTTPWRIVAVGSSLDDLVNNRIVYSVNPAKDETLFANQDSWVKPGRSTWSWIADGGTKGVTPENMRLYAEEAAKLGFEYNTIDEGWVFWNGGNKTNYDSQLYKDQLTSVANFAKQYGVNSILWSAMNNMTGNMPGMSNINDVSDFLNMAKETGMAGTKIDFWPNESNPANIGLYLNTLQEAAKDQLMVIFHGSAKPTGWDRTYPNEISREGIRGYEQVSYDENSRDPKIPYAPYLYYTTQPFTRFLQGHADFTPETRTAGEIASLVLTDSPIQMIATSPQELLANPAVEMIKSIPTVWDKTVVLPQSEIGKTAIIAKQAGGNWFIGGVANTSDVNVDIDLNQLLGDGTYQLDLWRDTVAADQNGKGGKMVEETRNITKNDHLTLAMLQHGGFIARISKLSLSQYGGVIGKPIMVTAPQGATVKYTVDGSDPLSSATAKAYPTAGLTLKESTNLKVTITDGDGKGTTIAHRFNAINDGDRLREDLTQLINQSKTLNPSEYTPDSYAEVQTAQTNAEKVLADEKATDDAITKAGQDLTAAMNNLILKAAANVLPTTKITDYQGGEPNSAAEALQKAFDGDKTTIWHTNWNGTTMDKMSWGVVFDKAYPVNGFTYLPRQSGSNGIITEYQIVGYTSLDENGKMITLATGKWAGDATLKTINFPTANISALVFVPVHTIGDSPDKFASAAEFQILIERTAPTIEGIKDITIPTGTDVSQYNWLSGITATDTIDGDVTGRIKVDTSAVDTSKAGDYNLIYTATNKVGTLATQTVKVHVVGDEQPGSKQKLTADSITIKVGDNLPKEADFNIVALDKDGNAVTATADVSKVKTDQVGSYPVVITTTDGQTITVQVNVEARATGAQLTADSVTIKVGDPAPTQADFHIVAQDKDGKPVAVEVDLSKVNTAVADDYPVLITTADGQKLTVFVHVTPRGDEGTTVKLTADNVTIKVGDPLPQEADFHIVAQDKDGKPVAVQVDLSKVNPKAAGDYPVVIKAADGKALTVIVHVIANGGGGTVTPPTPVAKTKFTTIDRQVLAVQAGKAPQYQYDAASDSFKVSDQEPSLAIGTEWLTVKKGVTTDGTTYYQVSGVGYVRAEDITNAKITLQKGVVVVTNANGAVARLNTTGNAAQVQTLKPGTAWQYTAVATNPDGTKAYRVADKQWVSIADVRVQNTQITGNNYPVYVQTNDARLYHYDASTGTFTQLERGLKLATGWKSANKAVTADGTTYYRVSTDEWLRGSDVTANAVTGAKGVVTIAVAPSAKTSTDPDGKATTEHHLLNGTHWLYSAVAQNADGTISYLVANNEWVQARDVRDTGRVFTIGSKDAPLVNGQGNPVNRTLKAGTAWKVTGWRFIDGALYYRVSTNGFVRADLGRYE